MKNIYASYKKVRNASWQVLIDFRVNKLPVIITKITSEQNIVLLKNSDVGELKKDEVGISYYEGNQWYIIYDDTMPKGRIRFTAAHELGHIFLGHELIGQHRRSFDPNKPKNEIEADIFASRLLAPACVLWGLNVTTADEIMELCGISYQAAEIRAERMAELYRRKKFLTSPLERQVYEQFKDFINERRR